MVVRLIGCLALAAVIPMTACMHADSAASPSRPVSTGTGVVFNGVELTEAQLAMLKELYGVIPASGHWWYDPANGMYGMDGKAPSGVMHTGHDFGPMREDASAGTALVVINGRRLTTDETEYLASLAGGRILPGRYWLDDGMNWGLEGNSFPLGNLRHAAAIRHEGPAPDAGWAGMLRGGDNESLPGTGTIASN
jgi:hypothetical protein